MPMLVCALLISTIGMMLHELEHDPFGEEAHFCAICLSSAPLDNDTGNDTYLIFTAVSERASEALSVSDIHHRPMYHFFSRAPPVNFLV